MQNEDFIMWWHELCAEVKRSEDRRHRCRLLHVKSAAQKHAAAIMRRDSLPVCMLGSIACLPVGSTLQAVCRM